MFDHKDPSTIFYLTKKDMTKDFFHDYFAIRGENKEPLLPVTVRVKIDKDIVSKAKNNIAKFKNYADLIGKEEPVGRILTNLFILDIPYKFTSVKTGKELSGNLLELVDYVDKPFNKKVMGNLDDAVAVLYVDGRINDKVLEAYVNNTQWLGYTNASYNLPSLDMKTLKPSKKIIALKDKLLKENMEEILSNNVEVFTRVEKEILDAAVDDLKKNNATGYKIYESGYNGSLGNNFKVTSLMRGIAPSSDDIFKFSIVTSNLVEGVAKKDIPAHADLAVLGASGRAKDTRMGGYKSKIFNAAFSTMVLDDSDESDCKTDKYSVKKLDKSNINDYKYRFIMEGGKPVELSEDNMSKYIGKTVHMRSVLYCQNRKICSKCIGTRMYRIKVHNIGLHISRLSSAMMLASMKAFHNMSVDPSNFNLIDYIQENKK